MRKQELIHLHALTIELRSWLEEHHGIDGEFDAYDEGAVSRHAIHRRKGTHKEAVRLAMDGVVSVIERAEDSGRAVHPTIDD